MSKAHKVVCCHHDCSILWSSKSSRKTRNKWRMLIAPPLKSSVLHLLVLTCRGPFFGGHLHALICPDTTWLCMMMFRHDDGTRVPLSFCDHDVIKLSAHLKSIDATKYHHCQTFLYSICHFRPFFFSLVLFQTYF